MIAIKQKQIKAKVPGENIDIWRRLEKVSRCTKMVFAFFKVFQVLAICQVASKL